MNQIHVSFGIDDWTIHAEDGGRSVWDRHHSYSIYWVNDYKKFRSELDSVHESMCDDKLLRDSFKYSLDVECIKQQHALRFLVSNLRHHGIDR